MVDIIVASRTEKKHLAFAIRHGDEGAAATQVYAKLSKCSFAQSELLFLGHIVGKDRVRVDGRCCEGLYLGIICKGCPSSAENTGSQCWLNPRKIYPAKDSKR